jgi:hypothetical protein
MPASPMWRRGTRERALAPSSALARLAVVGLHIPACFNLGLWSPPPSPAVSSWIGSSDDLSVGYSIRAAIIPCRSSSINFIFEARYEAGGDPQVSARHRRRPRRGGGLRRRQLLLDTAQGMLVVLQGRGRSGDPDGLRPRQQFRGLAVVVVFFFLPAATTVVSWRRRR